METPRPLRKRPPAPAVPGFRKPDDGVPGGKISHPRCLSFRNRRASGRWCASRLPKSLDNPRVDTDPLRRCCHRDGPHGDRSRGERSTCRRRVVWARRHLPRTRPGTRRWSVRTPGGAPSHPLPRRSRSDTPRCSRPVHAGCRRSRRTPPPPRIPCTPSWLEPCRSQKRCDISKGRPTHDRTPDEAGEPRSSPRPSSVRPATPIARQLGLRKL